MQKLLIGILIGLMISPTQIAVQGKPLDDTVYTDTTEIMLSCANFDVTPYSKKQQEIIKKSIQIGEDEGIGHFLAAIAIQESQAGKFNVNAKTNSYGPYHILLKTALSRMDMTDASDFKKNVIASRLVNDINFSAQHAISEIRYWQSIRGEDNWEHILASYNGGWKAMSKKESVDYAKTVLRIEKQIRTCSL